MDNKSSMTPRIVLGGVIVSLVVAAVVYMTGRDDTGGMPAPTSVAPAANPAPRIAAASSPPASAAPAAPDRPPLMPEELIEEVLKKDKRLGLFMQYHKTVLLDASRRDEYRAMLADPDMMTAMADALMDPGQGEVKPDEHYRRLMQIDYFDAAMTWKDNPARDKVLEVAGSIIAKDNFLADQGGDRKQTLAGGKMELYRLLYEQDPAKAEALVALARGTRMEALTGWMAQENLRRRAKEEQIRTEMQELQAQAQ